MPSYFGMCVLMVSKHIHRWVKSTGVLLGLVVVTASCTTRMVNDMKPSYSIRRVPERPALQGRWDEPAWREANVLSVDHFMAEHGSDHRPITLAKVAYADDGLFVFFKVTDRYVVCRHTQFQSPVYKDSCAEFFVQPKADKGYFNFEMNCGGSLLVTYIEDSTRTPTGFKKYTKLPPEADALIQRYHSLPQHMETEQAGPVEWCLEYFIPFSFFERYVGPLGPVQGQTWRANFFKCADESSHPHWATWAPLDPDFAGGFHRPDKFGLIRFE